MHHSTSSVSGLMAKLCWSRAEDRTQLNILQQDLELDQKNMENELFVIVFVFFVTLITTAGVIFPVKHSLTYIYTAFSKPVELPGIHEFSAMGLLDNRMIDYYDSTVQKHIPKQDWIKEEYWDECKQFGQSKQLWLKVNIDILIKQTGHDSNDTHVLQWMHGCEGEEDEQGNLTFVRGMDMFNYDGEHLLHFDDEHLVWVAAADATVDTKRMWGEVTALKDYTKEYQEKEECMNCMKILLECSKQQLRNAPPPDVYMFSKKAKQSSNVVLTCLATGFYPKDITLNIRRDGRVLTRDDDGLNSSGVRPNHDETFQRADYVEILRSDSATYTCEFIHPASNVHVVETWDHHLPPDDYKILLIYVGTVLNLLILLVIIFLFLHVQKPGIFRCKYQPTKNKDPEDMNSGSAIEIPEEDKDGLYDAEEAATNLQDGRREGLPNGMESPAL